MVVNQWKWEEKQREKQLIFNRFDYLFKFKRGIRAARVDFVVLFCLGRCLESIRFAQIQIARSVRAFAFHFGALSVSMRKIPNKRIPRWEEARTERPLSWDGKLTLDTEFAHDLTYIIEGSNLKLKKRKKAII